MRLFFVMYTSGSVFVGGFEYIVTNLAISFDMVTNFSLQTYNQCTLSLKLRSLCLM